MIRAALWFLALFGIAVATALIAGNNQAVVTLFWPPHRVDLSFNLTALLLAGFFFLLYLALRALSAVFSLPSEARRWRAQQKERAMYGALMDALSHWLAGRYIRSSSSALLALAQEKSLATLLAPASQHIVGHSPGRADQLRSLAHLLVAESAQSLQNKTLRDENLQRALSSSESRAALPVREGVVFRAARWALEDRDPGAALDWLAKLPQGASRRTLALRMRLKAARQAREISVALDTARLLAKHGGFSPSAAQSIIRSLALESLNDAHDAAQLQRAWDALDVSERAMPELGVHAGLRLMALHGDADLARAWAQPAWEKMIRPQCDMSDTLKIKLVSVLELGLASLDAAWLARIEAAQQGSPRDANLQYLAGMACVNRQLWGKARQLLSQAVLGLQDATLRRQAWLALAVLADQRADAAGAAHAYQQAARA